MTTFTVQIPRGLKVSEHQARMAMAAKLYEAGLLTTGQAADLVGVPKADFMEGLHMFDVPLFDYPPEELIADIRHAKGYHL